jgi:hypothetical protein
MDESGGSPDWTRLEPIGDVGSRVGIEDTSPWDNPSRRPSLADKRRAWRRELLGQEIRAVVRPGVTEQEIRAAADRLLSLAA